METSAIMEIRDFLLIWKFVQTMYVDFEQEIK